MVERDRERLREAWDEDVADESFCRNGFRPVRGNAGKCSPAIIRML